MTKHGDSVVVLFSGDVPFILRKERNHYRFVGSCYVQGILDGEVVVEKEDKG